MNINSGAASNRSGSLVHSRLCRLLSGPTYCCLTVLLAHVTVVKNVRINSQIENKSMHSIIFAESLISWFYMLNFWGPVAVFFLNIFSQNFVVSLIKILLTVNWYMHVFFWEGYMCCVITCKYFVIVLCYSWHHMLFFSQVMRMKVIEVLF